jgi:class 3 adenylate cyclase
MQDRKIQNFLAAYLKIFTQGLLTWFVKNTDEAESVQKHMVPSMFKNLGDGLMLTWEIPPGMDLVHLGSLTHGILELADIIASIFCNQFHYLNPAEQDAYSREVQNLLIGFGTAKGHAWRLDFGHSVDYAGSIINLASRLEAHARPHGVVATYDTSPWLFDLDAKEKRGQLGTLKGIRGYDEVKIWVSPEVDTKDMAGFKPIKLKALFNSLE